MTYDARRPSRSPAFRVPAYCLHRSSGRAYVTIGGSPVYLGKYGSQESKDRYDRLIAEYLASGRQLAPPEPSLGVSVNELLLAYLRHAQSYYRKASGEPTSEFDQLCLSVRDLRQLYGMTPANQFSPLCLKALQRVLIDRGLARQGVNRRISRVLRVFKWGVGEELVDPMVHHALAQTPRLKRGRTPAPESEKVVPVEEEHIEAVRPYVSRQVWAIIRLQRLTGMRPGEVCLMRGADLDCAEPVWFYSPCEHKTEHHGYERRIPVGPQAQEVVREWLGGPAEKFLFSPADAEAERRQAQRLARKTRVQPSQKNRRKATRKRPPRESYDRNSYKNAIRRACRKAGVEPWSANQLRHTFATAVRKRYGIEAASVLLGHHGVSVTQVYAERDGELAQRVAAEAG